MFVMRRGRMKEKGSAGPRVQVVQINKSELARCRTPIRTCSAHGETRQLEGGARAGYRCVSCRGKRLKRPRARKRLPKSVGLLAAAASTGRMRSHQIEPLEGELAASRSPGFGRLKMALLLHAMICTRDIDDEEEGSGRRIDALIIEPRIAPAGGRLAASPRFLVLSRGGARDSPLSDETRRKAESARRAQTIRHEGSALTALDSLLVHDSAPALATPDRFPRLDLVRRGAVFAGWDVPA